MMSRLCGVLVAVLVGSAPASLIAADIDPLLLIPGPQLPALETGGAAHHGQAMAYSDHRGGLLVVGVPRGDVTGSDQGQVMLYRQVQGSWTPDARLTVPATHQQVGQRFGEAVAVAGDWLAVGAPYEDVNSHADVGAVYLFRFDPGLLRFEFQQRVSSGTQAGKRFGSAIAMRGDRMIVGAPLWDRPDSPDLVDVGMVASYQRLETGVWQSLIGYTAVSANGSESYGSSLAIVRGAGNEPDHLFVGAPTTTVGGQAVAGRVHHMRATPEGWTLVDEFDLPAPELLDWYGSALAASGEFLFIGMRGRSRPGAPAKGGAVQVRRRNSAGAYVPYSTLYPVTSQSGANFGASLAVNNRPVPRLIVGAPGFDRAGLFGAVVENAGRIHVFDPVSAGGYVWQETNTLVFYDFPGSGDAFGSSVAVAGDNIVNGSLPYVFAGSPGRRISAAHDGSVQVFRGDRIFEDGFAGLE